MSTTFSMASFSPLTPISTTHSSSHCKPHHHNTLFTLTLRPKNLPFFTLSPLRVSAGTSDSPETAVKPSPDNISVGTNGSASAVSVTEEVKVTNAFVDARWVAGTWDLMQFRKNGTTDWDAVIDAEARRRKWLEHNEFSGSFPSEMIQTWNTMKTSNTSELQYEPMFTYLSQNKSVEFMVIEHIPYSFKMSNKGHTMIYEGLQNFYSMIVIDISSNKFSGEIPKALGDLKGLVLLNLSNNIFTGSIPSSLGKLSNLEALDLSLNNLSGGIPQQLTQLTFLEFLNVSFNNLTGPIPQNKQFSTFQGDSFEGNKGLCGDQLVNKCLDHAGHSFSPLFTSDDDNDSESFFEIAWKVSLIGYIGGLVAGVALGSSYGSQVLWWLKRFF